MVGWWMVVPGYRSRPLGLELEWLMVVECNMLEGVGRVVVGIEVVVDRSRKVWVDCMMVGVVGN